MGIIELNRASILSQFTNLLQEWSGYVGNTRAIEIADLREQL